MAAAQPISLEMAPQHNDELEQVIKPMDSIAADDKEGLFHIGKQAAFKRKFNLWTAIAIAACATGAWEGLGAAIFQVLLAGGPVGLVYGYICCATTMICVAASLAEFASIWPSSGAQYHWAAELAPKRFRAEISWLTGWLTITGTVCASILCGMGVAMQIQAYAIVANPDYLEVAERWHVYLIYLAICIIYLCINIFSMKLLHFMNLVGGVFHVLGYLLIIIVLAAVTNPKNSAEFVFTSFQNGTGWSSGFVSFCIGLMTTMNGFPSVEISAHFSEEIKHAPLNVPRAMFWTICLNAIFVFPWIILILFCLGDLEDVLSSPIATTSPMTVIFVNATGSVAGSIVLNTLGLYSGFMGGLDTVGSCARTIWAMARDEALPPPFRRINPKYEVPIWCILSVFVVEVLIGLIYIWNTTAFYGITSGSLTLFCISYAIPIGLNLFVGRRNPNITPGRWNIGVWGWGVNIIAFVWLIFISIFLCFPVYYPTNAETMNYSSLITGGFALLSGLLYLFYGRKRFNGPVVELYDGVEPGVSPQINDNVKHSAA